MAQRKKNIKFKYLIVPCPGDPNFHGDEVKLSDLEDDKFQEGFKLYLGAEDRMMAAVMKARGAENVVLVGGSQSKVVAMYIYFQKVMRRLKYEVKPKFICLVSNPDSAGNLSAFRRYLEYKKLEPKDVAIISNNEGRQRLELVWKSLFPKVKLKKMFRAENLLDKGALSKIYEKELKRVKIREKRGCMDWRKKRYKNYDKINPWVPKFWKCEELTLNFEEKDLSDCDV